MARRVQMEDGVFLDTFDKEPETFLAIPGRPFCKAAIRDIFKRYSQEITGKRKNSHRINSLPYTLVTVGNLSQVQRLSRAQCSNAFSRNWRLQDLGEIGEGFPKEHLSWGSSDSCSGPVDINNSERLD